jgi:hypothetical protein
MVETIYLEHVSVSYFEHSLHTYLNAVVTVGKVVHRLELLVDNPNASLVGPVNNAFNVFGGLAKGLQLNVKLLGGLNGSLRVELGCSRLLEVIIRSRVGTDLGKKP